MEHINFYAMSGFTILLVTLTTLAFGFAPGLRRWGFLGGLIFWTVFGMVILAKYFHAIDLIRYVIPHR
ncbi:MAG: hypothetical protein WDN10_00475 [bacterium]